MLVLLVCGCAQRENNKGFLQDGSTAKPMVPEIVPYELVEDEWDSLYVVDKSFYDGLVACVFSGKSNVIMAGNPLSFHDTMHVTFYDTGGKSSNDSLELQLVRISELMNTTTETKKVDYEPEIMTTKKLEYVVIPYMEEFNLYFASGKPFAVEPFCDEFRCERAFIEKLRSCAEKSGISLKAMMVTPYWD
jgi:hypothetical protein